MQETDEVGSSEQSPMERVGCIGLRALEEGERLVSSSCRISNEDCIIEDVGYSNANKRGFPHHNIVFLPEEASTFE